MNKTICAFGSYKGLDNREDIVRVGQLLAEKGYTVISGGFSGTMEDISKGAKSAGGKTIGITYYKKSTYAKKHDNKHEHFHFIRK